MEARLAVIIDSSDVGICRKQHPYDGR